MLTLLHLFVTSLVPLSPHQKKGHISSLNFLIFVAFMNYVGVSLQNKCIPQCSHIWFLGCCLHELHRCFFKLPAWENDLSHDSHLWSLWLSWTVWMCVFKLSTRENDLPQDSHLWLLWTETVNSMVMCFQFVYFRKWFTTRVTFVIFGAFMNCVSVIL